MVRLRVKTFLSKDRRKRVGWANGLGVKGQKISEIVGVSRATVYRHIHR